MSNARFWLTLAVLVVLTAVALISFMLECRCDWCDGRFAIWARGDRQFCRGCKKIFDNHTRQVNARRSLLRRIFRANA